MESDFRLAKRQRNWVYVEKTRFDPKSGKPRHLCYPRSNSVLFGVQDRIKDRILADLELLDEVRGYRKKSHNINAAAEVSGAVHLGKVDISKFHPSITRKLVASALRQRGITPSWAREIARIVTFKNRVPQGAPSSNHVANVVMDYLLRRFIVPFAARMRVSCINFGDDIAFFGNDACAVRACVTQAKNAFSRLGFASNDKCRDCEHRGGAREFIGCTTGRDEPDHPRKKYRAIRTELRALIQSERMRCAQNRAPTEGS